MKRLTEKRLVACLPHGSGIDCDWVLTECPKYWKCENSYHCMNEFGYYDGYADFSLIIKKLSVIHNAGTAYEFESVDFNLHFHGSASHSKNQKYFLREYLEEIFAQDLDDAFCPKEVK